MAADLSSFDPDHPEREVVRLTSNQPPRITPGALRYDLESATTLLAGFAWLGSEEGAGTFRRKEWERGLRVVRLHYGSPFQLDIVTVESTLAILGGLGTLALCFERVPSGIEKLSSGQKMRAEARQIDMANNQVVDDALARTAKELPAAQSEKLRELSQPEPDPGPIGLPALEAGRHSAKPDQAPAVGRAFRRIAIRGGRIRFRP